MMEDGRWKWCSNIRWNRAGTRKADIFKQELKEYYKAPQPARKKIFLRAHAPHSISRWDMLCIQMRYISKMTWVCSAAVFAAAVILTYLSVYAGTNIQIGFGSAYGLVPFLVMISITECMKSCRYGMQELEQAALFSVQSVIMARMVVLGLGNLLALFVLAAVGGPGLSRQFLYLIVPYLVTAAADFEIVRRFRGTEGMYLCAGASALVAVVQCIIQLQWSIIYEENYVGVWFLAAVVAAAAAVQRSRQMIQTTEDIIWS